MADVVVAYGLKIVVVVVGSVVVDPGGGAISAALWVGDDGVSLVGMMAVVEIDGDVVAGVVRVVVACGAEVDVVREDGVTGAEGRCRELSAVWRTANTRISRSKTAAAPEA
ncbi:hypothetical protein [Candidatus Mycolicibacterium alkanivorans]|uniref:Uncharacterized protein n=1 Tax=Candidatus Mycolicibacterium alkanivorans TaxID=2954114 RepID=A0ABS9YTM9_9MYCO|nr:hypothetical protein [Candidatus Mycolicibacterium alkanivorans]MCI4673734.1 hypothetical protein [Candidatus Mycolicibacterium alkanivorans]